MEYSSCKTEEWNRVSQQSVITRLTMLCGDTSNTIHMFKKKKFNTFFSLFVGKFVGKCESYTVNAPV